VNWSVTCYKCQVLTLVVMCRDVSFCKWSSEPAPGARWCWQEYESSLLVQKFQTWWAGRRAGDYVWFCMSLLASSGKQLLLHFSSSCVQIPVASNPFQAWTLSSLCSLSPLFCAGFVIVLSWFSVPVLELYGLAFEVYFISLCNLLQSGYVYVCI